jgi:hypothetical protein
MVGPISPSAASWLPFVGYVSSWKGNDDWPARFGGAVVVVDVTPLQGCDSGIDTGMPLCSDDAECDDATPPAPR